MSEAESKSERVVAYFGEDALEREWARAAVVTLVNGRECEDPHLHVSVQVTPERPREAAMALAQKELATLLRASALASKARAEVLQRETAALFVRAGGGQA